MEKEEEKSRLLMDIYIQKRINQYFRSLCRTDEEEETPEFKEAQRIQEEKNELILKIMMQKMMNHQLNQLNKQF